MQRDSGQPLFCRSSAVALLCLVLAASFLTTSCRKKEKPAPPVAAAPEAAAPAAAAGQPTDGTQKAEAPATTEPAPAGAAANAGGEGAGDEGDATGEPQPDPQAIAASKFKAIRDAAVADLEVARRNSGALPALKQQLQALKAELAKEELNLALPAKVDLEAIHKVLQAAALTAGFKITDVQLVESPVERPAPATEYPFGKEQPVVPVDFMQPWIVTVALEGAPKEKLAEWVKAISKSAIPLLPRRAKTLETGFVVSIETYTRHSDTFPIIKSSPKDLKKLLKRRGFDAPMEELVRMDQVGHLQLAADAFSEFNQLINVMNASNLVASELRWLQAQLDWLKEKRRELSAVTLEKILI